MKRTSFSVLSLLFLACLPSFALNYTINFTGSGASTSIDNVLVQNLSKGTSVTVPAGNVLYLYDISTAVEKLSTTDDNIHVYPSGMEGKSTLSFFSKQAGNTQINVFNFDGRKVVSSNQHLQSGINTFLLSLKSGTYVIQVIGNGYSKNNKIINQTGTQNNPGIAYIGTEKPTNTILQKSKSASNGTTSMLYTAGDQLLYKATSSIYSTIVTDVPEATKTTNFVFVACTDADGNNYTTVTIGTQIWMAVNLGTTKYSNGEDIGTATGLTPDYSTSKYQWPTDGNESNVTKYGRLYTWYAVTDNRSIAPAGWHVPTDAEWTTLTTFGGDGGKLKETGTLNWLSPNAGATNESGFSALPSGFRNPSSQFNYFRQYGFWWTSSADGSLSWNRYVIFSTSGVYRASYYNNFGLSVRCIKDELPTLTTTAVTGITNTTAISGGDITSAGSSDVTEKGVCWSKNHNPSITDSKTSDGTGTETFVSNIAGLTSGETYYVRAYATCNAGTAYGNEVSLTSTIKDVDGNVYTTVTIGTQTWMVENLKTTKYRDGTAIDNVTDNVAWAALSTGAWCDYENSAANGTKYGHLYNIFAVTDSRNLAPTGWHVATDVEWTSLTNYVSANLGTSLNVAKALAATTDWTSDSGTGTVGNNLSINNFTGFSALPGGSRISSGDLGKAGLWWCSFGNYNFGKFFSMNYNQSNVGISAFSNGGWFAFSIRCVKDN